MKKKIVLALVGLVAAAAPVVWWRRRSHAESAV
jgi:hypothetical protein